MWTRKEYRKSALTEISIDKPYTWIASSLVGQTTITPVPFLGEKRRWKSSSIAGIRNARVFPDPVLAAPITSFPSNRCGIDLAWICRHENNHTPMSLINTKIKQTDPPNTNFNRNSLTFMQLIYLCQKQHKEGKQLQTCAEHKSNSHKEYAYAMAQFKQC